MQLKKLCILYYLVPIITLCYHYYYNHYTNKETESEKGQVTCLKSFSSEVVQWEFELVLSSFRTPAFSKTQHLHLTLLVKVGMVVFDSDSRVGALSGLS